MEALVVRSDDERVELLTRAPGAEGYQRIAVDAAALAGFIRGLFALT